MNNGRTQSDHEPAEHNDGNDAPKQRPILVFPRDSEVSEDQTDHKDIVDRKSLFDEISGIIFHAEIAAFFDPDPNAEKHGNADIEDGEFQAFGNAHFLVLFVEDPKVKGRQSNDDANECKPKPNWRS